MKVNTKNLTVQVLVAIILGILVGILFPKFGVELKVLPDVFIKMVKMVISPIVFFTVVLGICGMDDIKKIGRIGGKAILYFEIVTTIALALGLLVANIVKPGSGINISAAGKVDVSQYAKAGTESKHGFIDFIVGIIPDNVVGAFASGEMLPVLFFSVLFGLAMASMGSVAAPAISLFEKLMQIFFKVVSMIMRFSPFAALGAMAYTIGKFGPGTLVSMGKLVGSVYITMFLFIVGVLGLILKVYGFNIFKFLKHIKEEIFLAFGTCSSEPALPDLMKKLENYGCAKSVVGFVTPTGYAFNLDGTAIYMTLAALFISQAYGIDLTMWQQITLLGIMMLTSKGAAAVTGGGFITLGATLAAFPMLPIEGLALLLGVDRFLAEARGVTNLIGNGVATLIISKSENEFNPPVQEENSKLSKGKEQVHNLSGYGKNTDEAQTSNTI